MNQGIPSLYAGLVWSGIGFAGLFNGWIGGKAIDRWPSGYTLASGLTLGTIGACGVITNNMFFTVLGATTVGLVSFITPPLMTTALLRRHVPHHAYAPSLSIATAFCLWTDHRSHRWRLDRRTIRLAIRRGIQRHLYGACRCVRSIVWTTATKAGDSSFACPWLKLKHHIEAAGQMIGCRFHCGNGFYFSYCVGKLSE